MLKRLLLAIALALAVATTAFAAELTAEQQAALEARVASFDTAMRESDIAAVMSVVPPKVLQRIADQFNVSIDDLIAATQQQMDELLKTVTIESFSMDLANARYEVLPDATPYGLIPSETVIDMGADLGKVRTRSETLALLDENVWYLVRTEDPQQNAILREIYPAFVDVEFLPATTEPVTE